MAFLTNCMKFESDFCISQNYTEERLNLCVTFEEAARLESFSNELTCYMIETAMYLLSYCNAFSKWKFDDPMSCAKQYGAMVSVCYSPFPDYTSEFLTNCLIAVDENIGKRQNETQTEWFYHIIQVACSMKNINFTLGGCGNLHLDAVIFNGTMYAPKELLISVYAYVVPTIGAVVVVTNTVMLVFIAKIIYNDSVKLLMCTICVSEMLTALLSSPLFLGIVVTNTYEDYLPYGWCLLIMITCDVLTPLFHSVSVWFALGMTIQRYVVITFPFTVRSYGIKGSRNVVLRYMAVTLLIASLSFVPELIFIGKTQQVHVMSKTDISKEVVTAMIPALSGDLKNASYMLRAAVNQIIPSIFMLLFGTLLVVSLRNYKQLPNSTNQVKAMANMESINTTTVIMTTTVFLSEILPTIMIILNFALDVKSHFGIIIGFHKVFGLFLYPINLIVSCSIIHEFRQRLVCFRIYKDKLGNV